MFDVYFVNNLLHYPDDFADERPLRDCAINGLKLLWLTAKCGVPRTQKCRCDLIVRQTQSNSYCHTLAGGGGHDNEPWGCIKGCTEFI